MVAALYRRYRPESFAELIGQSHVTEPLSAAIRGDRVGHAYLFSGPRGCGKTTSARILARCLNCAVGPTPEPCGTCDSCRELSRDGGGSLDVVEIDAASHNGVDDARDLRERAGFAPARDRFKIFILDEAHMVTSQGFNALLKIVEEPPPHVKFIFATTEPDKVIGTIRSRTHHYPFRLIPPAPMLDYVSGLCQAEGVRAEPGVLPLVIRGGGGSARDTLSLLDQLIAGSGGEAVTYEQAVALLGYTHAELLDDAIEALGARDAGRLFSAIDRVIQSGQDPRRFVEDLLERLRDLILVGAARDPGTLLHGVPAEEIDTLLQQSRSFGPIELSRAADLVAKSLTEMTGATSPKVHLELMAARLLVPAAGDQELGALARLERLERRIGVVGAVSAPVEVDDAPTAPPTTAARTTRATVQATPAPQPASAGPGAAPAAEAAVAHAAPPQESRPAAAARPAPPAPGAVSLEQLADAWQEILTALGDRDRKAWLVVSETAPLELAGDVLLLGFGNQRDFDAFAASPGGQPSPAELLRAAIVDVLGLTVKYRRRLQQTPGPRGHGAAPAERPAQQPAPAASGGWAVAAIPGADAASQADSVDEDPVPDRPAVAPPQAPAATPNAAPDALAPSDDEAPPPDDAAPPPDAPEPAPRFDDVAPVEPAAPAPQPAPPAARPAPSAPSLPVAGRYGEAVVREELGAEFIEELPIDGSR